MAEAIVKAGVCKRAPVQLPYAIEVALSGKDPTNVDKPASHINGQMARAVAKAGECRRASVQFLTQLESFSDKDPTNVDRSAARINGHMARAIVKAGVQASAGTALVRD